MTAQTLVQPSPATVSIAGISRSSRLAAGALALAFGLFLLWGVGFAQPQVLHDTAHDSRHSFAFPCH